MEINNIINNPIQELSNVQPDINLDKVSTNEINNNSEQNSNSYSLDQTIPSKRSELSNNLSQYLSVISQSQIGISNLNQQSNILNDISTLTNEIVSSKQPEITSDNLQPNVSQLMSNYNVISNTLQLTQDVGEDSTSTAYFDGALGAKPLSVSDIAEAVEAQMKIVTDNLKVVQTEIQSVKTQALDTIGDEIAKNDAAKPFKNVDFGKMTSDFSSASINNVIGSVALTQANAIPVQAQKLLV